MKSSSCMGSIAWGSNWNPTWKISRAKSRSTMLGYLVDSWQSSTSSRHFKGNWTNADAPDKERIATVNGHLRILEKTGPWIFYHCSSSVLTFTQNKAVGMEFRTWGGSQNASTGIKKHINHWDQCIPTMLLEQNGVLQSMVPTVTCFKLALMDQRVLCCLVLQHLKWWNRDILNGERDSYP